jgi:hypothetical protein
MKTKKKHRNIEREIRLFIEKRNAKNEQEECEGDRRIMFSLEMMFCPFPFPKNQEVRTSCFTVKKSLAFPISIGHDITKRKRRREKLSNFDFFTFATPMG